MLGREEHVLGDGQLAAVALGEEVAVYAGGLVWRLHDECLDEVGILASPHTCLLNVCRRVCLPLAGRGLEGIWSQ